MVKLDHLAITVEDLVATRDWFTSVLGLEVEFETGGVCGLKDEGDFTLILSHDGSPPSTCALFFQVKDIHAAYEELSARGVVFRYPPQGNDWGYGAGLTDPDGRLVGLWDEKSMRDHETT
jgi:catechol 2,3-dioxygenase-like lactoylglutathione lyase family enzyme